MTGSIEASSSHTTAPPVALRKTVKGDGIELADSFVESKFVSGCFVGSSFSAELGTLADDGKIYFQDEASQMVSASVDIQRDETFLDVCASPGGKTTFVAQELTGSSAAFLVAGDITLRRVELLRETCVKQGAEFVNIVRYDAANALPFAERWFDWVLVDAPCTGTGTIRHNPEIRYFVETDDFVRMQKTQMAILSNASKLVKPKGKLLYSTCSIEKEENEDVCNAFLSICTGWRKVTPRVQQQFITSEGFARTYPHRDGLDGFFIATFQRS
jgi:16S rRNA (cytosine967-C5)-methyltransferase